MADDHQTVHGCFSRSHCCPWSFFSGLGDQGNRPTIHLRHHKFLVFAFQLQEFLPQPCHLLPRLQVGRRAVGSRGNRGVDAKKNSAWASLGGFKGRPVWNSRSCHTGCSWHVAMKDMKRIRKLHPPWSFDLLSAESQSPIFPASCAVLYRKCGVCSMPYLAVCQNLVPLVNIKIAGKWMFIPLKMVLIGIDPYPFDAQNPMFSFMDLSPWLIIFCRDLQGNPVHSLLAAA